MYLNVTTHSNLLKSTIRVEEIVKFLKEQNVAGCAITNEQLYNVHDFKDQLEAAGLNPVFGLRLLLDCGKDGKLPLFVYATNKEGFDNIMKLASSSMLQNDKIIKFTWLNAYKNGLLAIIPGLDNRWINKEGQIQALKQTFDKNLLLGIARTKGIRHPQENQFVAYAQNHQLPIVALHESYYLMEDDALAYEVLRGIDNGTPLESLTPISTQYYMPTVQEMTTWFADCPQWLENAKSIVASCKVMFPEYVAHMPEYSLTNGENPAQCLERLATMGLQVRLTGNVSSTYQIPQDYLDRLNYELSVINKMGYASYFLIVADYMAFARRAGILTGPGRGSSASSLVAYSLQITNVDPLQYGLLFERFLNPERVSLPDIDIDFIDSRRHEMIHYLVEKYGKDYVAQIGTFGNLTMKAAGRDVGRMLKFDTKTLKDISTMLDRTRKLTLNEAYECSTTVQKFVNASPLNQLWFKLSLKLEGITRNTSTHAAGVVLTPQPLIEYVPLQQGNEGAYLTQWNMGDVEKMGVLKVDLLGLRNLGIIEDVCKSLEITYKVKPTLETIPLNDTATFQLLQEGDVEGIFQLESEGMRQSLVSIVPTTINDIIAINALYRPGPMDFIKDYAARKLGQEQVVYPHQTLKPILEETYGIIIYQEQILKIAQTFAGFTIAEADLLRRAISKKKRAVLDQQKQLFVQGAVNQGHNAQVAEDIYSLIVKFAEYGFPKSHSTAYSLITYQMAFLKANYPSHFYSALLNNAMGNVVKVKKILAEMKKRGIVILPISLENSDFLNKSENKAVRLGFKNIKGAVEAKIKPLVVKPSGDFFSYAKQVGASFDNELVALLIKSGAYDGLFGIDRSTLLASLDTASNESMVNEFFNFSAVGATYQTASVVKSDSELEIEVMGFTIQAHPISEKRTPEFTLTFAQLKAGQNIKVLGQVDNIRETITKKQEKMAFASCSDESGTISVTLFPREYAVAKLTVGQTVVIMGKVEEKYGKTQIVANAIKHI
ncbi:MAG: DNA polymerase III subunit alpha [Kurthia sp.]|nr:DNA polymerase III subunit alpha [Candidatus Kurthia equi]